MSTQALRARHCMTRTTTEYLGSPARGQYRSSDDASPRCARAVRADSIIMALSHERRQPIPLPSSLDISRRAHAHRRR